MDLLQGIKDMQEEQEGSVGAGEAANLEDTPMPTAEDLLKALDGFSGMSEEDKESLRAQLMNQGAFGPLGGSSSSQFLILFALLALLTLIFVFFGYKLYKSLTEKERKRDEKRKMKQMKKKK